jgi:hypothetical protein
MCEPLRVTRKSRSALCIRTCSFQNALEGLGKSLPISLPVFQLFGSRCWPSTKNKAKKMSYERLISSVSALTSGRSMLALMSLLKTWYCRWPSAQGCVGEHPSVQRLCRGHRVEKYRCQPNRCPLATADNSARPRGFLRRSPA